MTTGVRELQARPGSRSGLTAAGWLLVGAGVGVCGAVMAQVAPWPVSSLPHYAAPYVLLLALIGASALGARSAAVSAAGCFLVFVVGYYVVVWVQFGAVPVMYAGAWVVAALTVCPLAAAIVQWSRASVLAAGVAAVAGAVALSDGAVGNLVRVAAGRGDSTFGQPVLAAVDLLVATIVVVVVPRGAKLRLLSVVLLVPFAVVAIFVGWAAHFGPGPYL